MGVKALSSKLLWPKFDLYLLITLCFGAIALIAGWFIANLPTAYYTPETLIVSLIGLAGVMTLWRYPEMGLGLYLYNGVFKTASVFGDPNSIVPTIFILSLTVIPLFLRDPIKITKKSKPDSILILIIIFNLFILFSAFGMSGFTDKAMRLGFFTTASFTMAGLIARDANRLLRAFRYFALLCIVTAVMSMATFVLGDANQIRSVTLFGANDVIYGRAIGLGIVMMLGLLLYDKTLSQSWRRLFLLMLPLAFINLILSTSRGGTVGLIVAGAFILFMNRAHLSRWVWAGIALIWPLYYFVFSLWGRQVQDLGGFSVLFGQSSLDMSTMGRILSYQNAISQFITSPLFGVGTKPNSSYPHNIFLEVASELGMLGLSIFLLLLWQLFLNTRKSLDTSSKETHYIVANLIAIGLIYSMTISQFSGNLQHQRELWMFIALSWGILISKKASST
ncbi:MAG: O-antigen ligase family protein [Ardenticatenaceae bacterium]